MTARKRPVAQDVVDAVAAYVEATSYAKTTAILTRYDAGREAYREATEAEVRAEIHLADVLAGGDPLSDATARIRRQLAEASEYGSARASGRPWEHTAEDTDGAGS